MVLVCGRHACDCISRQSWSSHSPSRVSTLGHWLLYFGRHTCLFLLNFTCSHLRSNRQAFPLTLTGHEAWLATHPSSLFCCTTIGIQDYARCLPSAHAKHPVAAMSQWLAASSGLSSYTDVADAHW